jgi:hypothetical protein
MSVTPRGTGLLGTAVNFIASDVPMLAASALTGLLAKPAPLEAGSKARLRWLPSQPAQNFT